MAILQSTTVTGSLIVSGSTDNLVQVIGSGSTLFSVNGASGQLFGIADDLTDSLFSVNTIAGLPVIEAFADNTVKIGTFGSEELIVSESQVSILSASLSGPTLFLDGNVGIGTTSPAKKLTIDSGDLLFTGNYSSKLVVNGDNTANTPMLLIGEQQTYGVGFRWNSGRDLDIVGYDNANVFSTSGVTMGKFITSNGLTTANGIFYWGGNVGIGTTDPGEKLDVTGNVRFGTGGTSSWGNGLLTMNAGWSSGNYPTLGSYGGSAGSLIMLHNPHIPFRTDNPISGYTGRAGLRMAIDTGATSHWDIGLAGDFFHIYKSSTGEFLRITNTGNVGIGTTSPSQKLTVAGTISGSSDLSIDGNSIFDGTVGYNTFNSGFGGNGWRIDANANAEFQNLTVRGTFSVYELLAQQVRATNGSLLVATSGKVDDISGTTLFFDTGSRYGHGFRDGDILLAQRLDPEGTSLKRTFITVDSISSTGSLVYTDLSGSTPEIGQEFVRIGNTSDVDRQGHIYLTADDSNAPYIGVRDGLSGSVQFTSGTGSIEKVRVGRLDGITSSTFGSLSGYGFFAKGNAYLEGGISATFGDIGGFGITETAISSSNDNLILRSNGQITGSAVLIDGDSKIAGFSVSGNSLHLDEGAVEVGLGTADQLSWSSAVVGLQVGEDADNRIFLGEIQGLYEFRVLTGGNSPVILGSRDNRISSWSLATTEIQGGTVSGGGDGSYTTSGIRLGADGYISAPKFYLSSGGDANFKGTVTIGSTDLDESNTLNTEDFTTGNINHNANFTLVAPDGRPSGWYAAYSNTSAGIVSYVDSNKTALKLYSASDVTIGVAGRAFQVDPTVEYTIKFRVKSNNATSAGFYFRIQELDSNLSEGDKFISHNSGNSETGAVEDTRQVTQASSVNPLVEASSKDIDNGPITTSYVDYEVLYTPTSTAKYASPLYLNWTDMSTNELHIDLCEIIINTADKKRGTVGGWTIQTDKIFSGTDEDVTGFTTSAGNLILSSSGAIHAKEFYVDKAGNAEFKGTLTAPGGNIGGFTISGDALAGSNFYLSGSATGNEFFISSSNFNVKANGDVTGSSVLFTGGRIGDEYQNITFDPTGNITLNNVELKVSDTTGLRTDIYDGANSKRVVLDDLNIYYTTFEDDTLITIIGTDGAIKSTITVDTKYTEGTISAADIAVGDILDADKPVSFTNVGGGHCVLPFSFLSKTFLMYSNRYQPRTIRVFSPFGDATVSASFSTSNDGNFSGGVAASIVNQNVATDINGSDIISGTWPVSDTTSYFKVESDLPILAFNDGPEGDFTSLYPLSKEILHADRGDVINLNPSTFVTLTGEGYYTANTPFQVQRIGDGDGGDSDQGMPVQALGDTYIIPHSVGGYEILSIEPNIIKVYTLTTGTKTLDNTVDHSAASKTNPINTLVGSDSAGGTSVHTGAMLFEGTAPFALRTQDPGGDEYHVIGYRRTQREIYDNSTTIKGDRIRTGKIQSNNWNNSTAGSLIDLDSGTAHLGGSGSNAAFYFDGTDLFLTGSINATSGNFTGTISAGDGDIGGWTIGASSLTAGDATLADTGNLTLGTSNDVVRLSADDGTYRLWTGHATAGSAPFSVTKTGALTASNATITGDITATNITATTAGNIAGWTIGSNTLSSGDVYLSNVTNEKGLYIGDGLGEPYNFQVGDFPDVTPTSAPMSLGTAVPTDTGTKLFVNPISPPSFGFDAAGSSADSGNIKTPLNTSVAIGDTVNVSQPVSFQFLANDGSISTTTTLATVTLELLSGSSEVVVASDSIQRSSIYPESKTLSVSYTTSASLASGALKAKVSYSSQYNRASDPGILTEVNVSGLSATKDEVVTNITNQQVLFYQGPNKKFELSPAGLEFKGGQVTLDSIETEGITLLDSGSINLDAGNISILNGGIDIGGPSSHVFISENDFVDPEGYKLFINSSKPEMILMNRANVGTISMIVTGSSGQPEFAIRRTTSNTEVFRIDNNGNVGIGTASPSAKLQVEGSGSTILDIQGSQGQLFSVTDDLTGTLFSVNDISGIPILSVDSDDTVTMGTFGTNALVVTGSNVGIGTATPSEALEVVGNISTSGNLILASGQGIDFSATGQLAGMTSELLDDYEEGTFTPTYGYTGGGNPSIVTYDTGNTYGKYTKIGNVVHCSGRIRTDAITWASTNYNAVLKGFPFTCDSPLSTGTGCVAGSIGFAGGFASTKPVTFQMRDGQTEALLYGESITSSEVRGQPNIKSGDFTTGTNADKNFITFQITYHTT